MSDLGPVDPKIMRVLEAIARELADVLDDTANGIFSRKQFGYMLMIFSFKGSELTYISNSRREDVVKMMLEFITHNPPDKTWDEQHG